MGELGCLRTGLPSTSPADTWVAAVALVVRMTGEVSKLPLPVLTNTRSVLSRSDAAAQSRSPSLSMSKNVMEDDRKLDRPAPMIRGSEEKAPVLLMLANQDTMPFAMLTTAMSRKWKARVIMMIVMIRPDRGRKQRRLPQAIAVKQKRRT